MMSGFARVCVGLALSLVLSWVAQAQSSTTSTSATTSTTSITTSTPTPTTSTPAGHSPSAEPQARIGSVPTGGAVTPPPVTPAAAQHDALTPSLEVLPEAIARQRQELAKQRSAILQVEEVQQVACWQKFAVNVCLSEARRARRQALEPLRQQDLALNAQERQWRTEQRDKRLQIKQPDNQGAP